MTCIVQLNNVALKYHSSTDRKLSDIDQDGALNAAEFFVAMTLIQHSLTGSALPLSLPSQLHTIVQKSVNPQLPVADESHLVKCKKAFKAFQSNIGVGVLGGEENIC